jgi:hypothetical protein
MHLIPILLSLSSITPSHGFDTMCRAESCDLTHGLTHDLSDGQVLDWIKTSFRDEINDPNTLYVSCMDTDSKDEIPLGRWLIFAKKNEKTIESECKEDICWTNQLDILRIIDVNNGNQIQTLGSKSGSDYVYCNRWSLAAHSYAVGKTTTPDPENQKYSPNPQKEKMNLGYFKSIDRAFFFQRTVPGSYTGTWYRYDSWGQIEKIENYLDGSLHGESMRFKEREIVDRTWYDHGFLHGPSIRYYPGGQVETY